MGRRCRWRKGDLESERGFGRTCCPLWLVVVVKSLTPALVGRCEGCGAVRRLKFVERGGFVQVGWFQLGVKFGDVGGGGMRDFKCCFRQPEYCERFPSDSCVKNRSEALILCLGMRSRELAPDLGNYN